MADTSSQRTLFLCPDGVRYREVSLYIIYSLEFRFRRIFQPTSGQSCKADSRLNQFSCFRCQIKEFNIKLTCRNFDLAPKKKRTTLVKSGSDQTLRSSTHSSSGAGIQVISNSFPTSFDIWICIKLKLKYVIPEAIQNTLSFAVPSSAFVILVSLHILKTVGLPL